MTARFRALTERRKDSQDGLGKGFVLIVKED
jgi:hypothetical protein